MINSVPSYLTVLTTALDKATLLKIQKHFGENTTAFKFNSKFKSLMLSWKKESDEYGGRVWGINSTGGKVILFDQVQHGYNGVMQLNEEDNIGTMKSVDFSETTDIVIAFQYSGDEAEYISEGSSQFEQDYFSSVAIYKYVNNQLEEIISFECA